MAQMDYRSLVDSIRQDTDEEERRRKERLAQRVAAAREAKTVHESTDKNVIDRIGDFLGGVAKSAGDTFNTVGTGIGRAVEDATGIKAERDAEFERSQDEWQDMLLKQIAKKKDPNLSDEERQKTEASITSITNSMKAERDQHVQQGEEFLEDTDPIKNAGAVAELASIPLTMGAGGIATQGAKLVGKELVDQTGRTALRRAGEDIVSEAGLGAAVGAAQVARDQGSEADFNDYLAGAGTGAAFGGVVAGGGQLLNRGVRQELGVAAREGTDAVRSQIQEFNSLPRSVREGGYIQAPAREAAEEVVDDPASIARVVTPEVNTQAPLTQPGEINPTTGLINTDLPEGSGVVTRSRDQIMKDNKVKRSFTEKVNEQFFDANAPLAAYSKEYKARTGKDLDVEKDPRALAQLRNGMDEAGAARMQSLVNDMSYIRDNKLGDAWREYGVANQVVNDRAGVYSPNIVAAESQKLQRLQQELSPEQFEQVQAAVQRTIDFQDGQLQRLRDNGFISKEGYDAIKEVNPNYFTRFNIAEYIQENQRMFASTNSKNISKNIVQAVKGMGDDRKFIIEDPAEAITRSAMKTENIIQNNKVFSAIRNLSDDLPDLAVPIRDADDVTIRMDLSLENQELRPIRDQMDKIIKRDSSTVRKLQTQINQLEKEGYNLSLKKGGERMTPGDITVSGLGGKLPTSQAGQVVETATDDATDLVQQLQGATKRTTNAAENYGGLTKVEREARMKAFNKSADVSDGLKQDVIIEGAGTKAETNPSMLGQQDTATFLRNLIETGSRRDIDRLKQMVGRRDAKVNALLDDIGFAKSEYDELAGTIRSNADEAKAHADLNVPEGYEVIKGYRNGIEEKVAVPQFIADAYKGKNDAQIGALENVMMAASKPFKAAATILSPAFLVKNSIRDTGTHWLTSQNISKAERLLIVPYAQRWVRGFMDSLTNSDFAQKISMEGGGAAGVFNSASDAKRGTEAMVKAVTKNITGEPVKSADGMFKTAMKMVGKYSGVAPAAGAYSRGMQRAGRALEYAPRLAEARAAIEKGMSDPAAALAARNALGDLQNGGTISRLLNNYTPFFNSIVQGNLRIVKAVRENPTNAAAMFSAGIAVPAVTGYLWNRTMYPDVLNAIPEHERENNFIVILGDEQDAEGNYTQVIKIPKNDAAKVFGNNIEVAMDKLAGEDSQGFAELFLKTVGYAQPIQIERDGQLSGDAFLGSAPFISSPLARVPIENTTNHSFFTGREVIPEAKQGLNAKDQVTENTGLIDRAAAEVGIAPQHAANIRQGVSAGLLGGKNPAEQIGNVVAGSSGTRGTNEFYKLRESMLDEKKRASNAINKAIAANDTAAARDIAQRYNAKFKSTFDPWVETYGKDADEDMREMFLGLRLNLTGRSIKQRRNNLKGES